MSTKKIGHGKNSKGEPTHWYTVTMSDHPAYIVSEEDWYKVNLGDYVKARLLKDGISIKS